MKVLRGFAAVLVGTMATCALVLGVALPANAGTVRYWAGKLSQNQIKESPTLSTIGGRVEMSPQNRVITVRATVRGLGSYQSVSTLSYSHARRTTSAYCQWRADYPQGVKYYLTCSITI
jgi:hypothetical protein